jgi:uncharacterized membrane protein YkoI
MIWRALILSVFTLAFAPSEGWAQWRDRTDFSTQLDAQSARDGVERGELRPLRDILSAIQARYPGRNLGQRLNRGNPPTYTFDWLTNDGRKLYIVVNAETGEILSVSGG